MTSVARAAEQQREYDGNSGQARKHGRRAWNAWNREQKAEAGGSRSSGSGSSAGRLRLYLHYTWIIHYTYAALLPRYIICDR